METRIDLDVLNELLSDIQVGTDVDILFLCRFQLVISKLFKCRWMDLHSDTVPIISVSFGYITNRGRKAYVVDRLSKYSVALAKLVFILQNVCSALEGRNRDKRQGYHTIARPFIAVLSCSDGLRGL